MATSPIYFLSLQLLLLLQNCACEARPMGDIPFLERRATYDLRNISGSVQVMDSSSNRTIPQGPATDGAGDGFNGPAVLWLLFALLIGGPLGGAGVRGSRYTSGAGIGLLFTAAFWIGIINTESALGISDIAITLLSFTLFTVGFFTGYFAIAYGADVFLGLVGGFSLGVRLVMLKPNLLIPIGYVNWILFGIFGGIGVVGSLWKRRMGVIVGSAASGTFLLLLGLDFIFNKQDGISRGLRYLFDKNITHYGDIFSHGYHPPLSTLIWIGVSIGLIPLCVYAQFRIFKDRPFWDGGRRALSTYAADAYQTPPSSAPQPLSPSATLFSTLPPSFAFFSSSAGTNRMSRPSRRSRVTTFISTHRPKRRRDRGSIAIDVDTMRSKKTSNFSIPISLKLDIPPLPPLVRMKDDRDKYDSTLNKDSI